MKTIRESLRIKLFADGADLDGMIKMAANHQISGLTTNPTLMRKAGIKNYTEFAKEVLQHVKTKPISFEVFSDELHEMVTQAEKIASWGPNVFVKIPITNTKGVSTNQVIKHLAHNGVKVNVTALMTPLQVLEVTEVLNPGIQSYISVFAGRIADTGRSPIPTMKESINILSNYSNSELIWASPREVLNVIEANEIGCDVITATNDIIAKLELLDKDLQEFSLDTVKMFYEDGQHAGYVL
jgi:transaldolase